LAAACTVAPLANAAIFTFTGTTTGKPTYTRPLEDLSALSLVGVGVNYDPFPFKVSVSGSYSFLTTGDFDTFTTLYSGSFIPASSLTNALIANDDLLPGFTTSGFLQTLTAGVTYVYVTTGFAPGNAGAYSTTIGGPGLVSFIPEPSTYLMLGGGLSLLALWRRRQRSAND
jgi:hypothetical protein